MILPFLFLMAGVNFEEKIAPVLTTQCLPCHGGTKTLGAVRLTTNISVARVVVAGAPEKSPLYLSIESGKMPPGGPPLSRTRTARGDSRLDSRRRKKWPAGVVLGPRTHPVAWR